MLRISKYATGMLETNVYFCFDTDTRECVIIDPADNADHIINIIDNELEVQPVVILLTHAHFDHMTAAGEVAKHYGIRIYVNALDSEFMADANRNLSNRFTFPVTYSRDDYDTFNDGDTLELIDREWKVLGTPGHTPGSTCFYIEDGLKYIPNGASEEHVCPVLFSGDTLFRGSHGRTDFPGGSQRAISESIREKLLVLPEETSVFSGHGPQTSIGIEKRYNPVARGIL
ncbi:MBL fold metallo-hydrolase [Oribacterium sp. WCC10]|uniref:MBL fold metallo-hydrolase n=1 Tax=Oribacterium sp. WCC10 TaxID=1855343 RepID=UPI0008F11642|nr:MBL fold metallo-hydrolase [Oribacterium sp. WCC10]SFG54108.1 Glyoxylase, beta-lactamase superfamily II [Oribacterium sp. WCC10]